MVKIIIVTHGNLGESLVETSKLIIGDDCTIDTVSLNSGDSIDEFKERVSNCIDKNISNNIGGVLLFADLYGGTPANSVLSKLNDLLFPENVFCFVGVNLPILLEAINMSSHNNINELAKHLSSVAPDSLFDLTSRFKSVPY